MREDLDQSLVFHYYFGISLRHFCVTCTHTCIHFELRMGKKNTKQCCASHFQQNMFFLENLQSFITITCLARRHIKP